MSITQPTTKEISDNIVSQIQTSLNQRIPLLPKSFVRVLARVVAGVWVILYKYGGFIFQQMFVSTASDQLTTVNGLEVVPLTEWGRLIGVGDPVGSTQAELVIDITVENQTGTLPAGSQVLGASNGVTYITIGDVALNASVVQANIRAVEDQSGGGGRGAIGNLDNGSLVTFANPLPNVSREAVVDSTVTAGVEGESTEDYRQRIIDRWTARPQGGAYADYRVWGTSVVGIAQVYPYTGDPGEVDVYVESGTTTDGVPTQDQLDAVADAIEFDVNGLATRRPAGALVNTLPIDRVDWITTVTGLSVPGNASAVESAVEVAVQEYFLDREPFIVGLDVAPGTNRIVQSAVIGVVEDVVTSFGGTFTTASIAKASNPGVPISDYTLPQGEKADSTTGFL
jgi:uncharacterized phage protein gp47/JayE